jgi:pimeloyl-ACP methyl ester carboxylesterase
MSTTTTPPRTRTPAVEIDEILLHGHRVRYRRAGEGDNVIVLVHGITGSSLQWEPVMGLLAAAGNTVIAPDLLGHGESAKPRGDYSLGAYASGLRDLLALLGHDRATMVGHSLGGGVAMIYAYQFPERVERMALVSSGGLGREVSILLRSATLPGAELVIPLLCSQPLRDTAGFLAGALGRIGLRPGADLEEMARGLGSLGDLEARKAFVHTARSIIDMGGQRVDAADRLYLAAGLPTMILWGRRDPMIPVAHGHAAHELIEGSRLHVYENAGHFPHRTDPVRFAGDLLDFIGETEPANITQAAAREIMLSRSAA